MQEWVREIRRRNRKWHKKKPEYAQKWEKENNEHMDNGIRKHPKTDT